MAYDDDYGFARWAVLRNKFAPAGASCRVANYLLNRANVSGLTPEVENLTGEPNVLSTLTTYDLYSLLRASNPDVLSEYYAELEIGEEHQARLDNARGKRY